ncbi:hypothetical protein AVEN_110017-1 [Araneus ventricosus]|uniref:RNase H type-1 domain-containing protein n=1 Tax=Araneus ventricosus TaxID=182803 RepID=A0A4Y2H234_ARAVE|nr:hypothetical protein AVEN_110017-1 [Araneus ventricosus]
MVRISGVERGSECVNIHQKGIFSSDLCGPRWPSGNEIADALAKAGADDASLPSVPLTYLELFSRAKSRNKTIWLIPPEHHWYQGSRESGCLSIDCNTRDQTTLTRFPSGYIRSLTVSDKCFEICPKCTAEQATPDQILSCLGLSQQDLVSNPLLTLDFFRVRRLMDLT